MQKLNRRSLLAAAAGAPLAAATPSTDPVRDRVVDAIDLLLAKRDRTAIAIALIFGGGFPNTDAVHEFLEAHWGPAPDPEPLPEPAAQTAPAPAEAERDAQYAALTSADNPQSVFYVHAEELTLAHRQHLRELQPEQLTAEQLDEIRRCFAGFDAEELSDSGGGVWFHRFVEGFDVKAGEGITVTTRVMAWTPIPAAEAVTA
jgi:hypothetical protein